MATERQIPRNGLNVWILSDGKIGDEVQCRAVAVALSPSFLEKRIAPRVCWAWTAPWGGIDPRDHPQNLKSPIAPPFPDVIVASGRRAVPYARAVKQASGGKTLIVFLKNPRSGSRDIDVIWAPAHDRLSSHNAFSTLTSPHGLGEKLAQGRKAPMPEIDVLAKPMLGVVLGGVGGGARYDQNVAVDLAAKIKTAVEGFASIAITPSRRTPGFLTQEIRSALEGKAAFFWDGEEANPYVDILANADALIVTADSHNMMSEALSTGAGVYAYRPPQLAKKLEWFVAELEKTGAVRPFEGSVDIFSHVPMNATDEIVTEIKRRLALVRR